MLPALPHLKAISLREEILTDGNSPIKVIANDYKLYVVKNSKSKNPATDIINEVLCYYLLHLWQLPVAEAAIIDIDPEQLLTEYTNNHRKHYYNKPVFASKWIEGALETNQFFEIQGRVELRSFTNPFDLFRIGLFDIWVENDDRKPTNHNLILRPGADGYGIIPIDHSFVFSTLAYKDLNPAMFYPIANENILVSDLAHSLLKFKRERKDEAENDREQFYLCIERCKNSFPQIVSKLPVIWGFTQADADTLFAFLFDDQRNKSVFQDYLIKVYQ